MSNKRIKIYTHHNKYLNASFSIGKVRKSVWSKFTSGIFLLFYFIGLVILTIGNFIKKFVINTCYNIGNAIFKTTLYTFNSAFQEVVNTKKFYNIRKSILLQKQFSYSIIIFLVISVLSIGFISSLKLVAKALDIKNKIYHTALIGNIYLNNAKDSLSKQDFTQAENNFALAYKAFESGQENIKQSGQALNQILSFIPQKQDADKAINSAKLISEAGTSFIALQKNIQQIKLTSAGITTESLDTAELFNNILQGLENTELKITKATKLINSINTNNLPSDKQEYFTDIKDKLSIVNLSVTNIKQIFIIAKELLIGDKKVLILFENNNELRASGGFMGTFGELSVKNGAIKSINVSSIYDLDGQLNEIIKPPLPILNLSDRWYLRDSNWFANFPDTARKISSFYEKEGGETPDLVIALTPNLVIDWLKITGPIYLPKYNLELSAENFIENTQVATTLSNHLPTNSPKQILADLVPVLLQKLSELSPELWVTALESVQTNLNNKQIAFYSRNNSTQAMLESYNWTGDIKSSDRDYLSIVSSNLGGSKSDLFVNQTIDLETNINDSGEITNNLTITRTNKLPKLESTNNLSYLRIFVPLGSKLLSSVGFDYKNLEYPENIKYKIDDDVLNSQKNSVIDMVTGTTIGTEANKTTFGNWVNLEGGETKIIKLSYVLPFKISNIDRYSLMLQKQLGTINYGFAWKLKYPGYRIAWKNFDPKEINTSDLISDIILDKDYFQGLVLEKR